MFASQRKLLHQNPLSLVYDRKFDTALRNTTCSNALKHLTSPETYPQWPAELKALDKIRLTFFPHSEWEDFNTKVSCLGSLVLRTLTRPDTHIRREDAWVSRAIEKAAECIRAQLGYLGAQDGTGQRWLPVSDDWLQLIQHAPTALRTLSKCTSSLTTMVEQTALLGSFRLSNRSLDKYLELALALNKWEDEDLDLKMYWTKTYCLISHHNKLYFYPRPYLLMIHNKFCDIMSVLLYAHFASAASEDTALYTTTLTFIRELAILETQFKQKYYDIAKNLEAIVIGMTLIDTDGEENKEFLDVVVYDLLASTGFYLYHSRIYNILSMCDISVRNELGCLSKILGHPFVDMASGAATLHKKTTEQYLIDTSLVQRCVMHAKKSFIKNHVVKHSRWPDVTFSSEIAPAGLVYSKNHNLDPDSAIITQRYGVIPITDFAYVELGKVMEFEYLDNYLPHLKDKTISVLRSKVVNRYLQQEKTDEGRIDWKETRLLLVYLMQDETLVDHRKFIDKYQDVESLETLHDYLVIRIVPKEKELKTDFRGFGCKPYMSRALSLAQEKNAMRFLDEYCDEQAMTLSELALAKKLQAFRNITKAYRGYQAIYINIDASSWNNHFRDETVRPVAKETLDRLFGTNLFCKTHEAYQNTLIYVPDETHTWFWEGQEGGIEGLNQDTWVWVYINQIKVALEEVDVRYHLLCKGDDLRVVILVPPDRIREEGVHKIKDRAVEAISRVSELMGHTIKVNDSYGSAHYLAFSKAASVGTIELPQVFRKIQKVYGANNAFIPTLDEFIGSTFSNAHSACAVSTTPIPCYCTALTWSFFYLERSHYYSQLPRDALIALMMVPSMVGGFPIIFLHNMFTRAESDLLSPFIGLLQFCEQHFRHLAQYMLPFTDQKVADSYTLFKGLLADPYTLPIRKPTSPAVVLRNMIGPILQGITVNKAVKQIMSTPYQTSSQAILDTLYDCNVYNAKIFSALYAATPDALFQELVRKFETSRSVHQLLIIKHGPHHAQAELRRVLRSEQTLQEYRVSVVMGRLTTPSFLPPQWRDWCPARIAQWVRDTLWGKRVEGVTMPPLQHQLILMTPEQGVVDEWARDNHFTYVTDTPTEVLRSTAPRGMATAGKTPFIGFTTRTGMVEPHVHFIEKDVMLQKVRALLDLSSWVHVSGPDINGAQLSSNFIDLIGKVLRLYIDLPATDLAPFSGKKRSGTIQHHVRSPQFRESIMPNVLSNQYQQTVGESNTHDTLRVSTGHFAINFLHVYCHAVSMIHIESNFRCQYLTEPVLWGVTTDCDTCNEPIRETPLVIPTRYLNRIEFHPIKTTAISRIAEHILGESIREANLSTISIPAEQTTDLSSDDACRALVQELCESTYHSEARVQERYSTTPMGQAGQQILSCLSVPTGSKIIGQTELARIPNALLFEGLAQCVLNAVHDLDPRITPKNIGTRLGTIPAPALPWYSFVNTIYSIGRLSDLIRHAASVTRTTPPAVWDSAGGACLYLGVCAYQAFFMELPSCTLVRLRYQSSAQVMHRIRRLLRPRIGYVLYTYFFARYRDMKAAHLDDNGDWPPEEDDTPRLLETIRLMLGATILADKVEAISIRECSRLERGETQLHFFDADDITEEDVYIIDADDPDTWPRKMRWVMEMDDEFPLSLAIDDLCGNLEASIARLSTMFRACDLTVLTSSLAETIALVRDLDPVAIYSETRVGAERPPRDRRILRTNHVWSGPGYRAIAPDTRRDGTRPKTKSEDPPRLELVTFRQESHGRIYGSGTTSVNKLIDILTFIGTGAELPDKGDYAILADGYGGFAEAVSSCTKESWIYFNTLRKDYQAEVFPHNARDASERNHNTIYVRDVHQSMDNLAHEATATRLLSYERFYHLVTMDAEPPTSRDAERLTLLLNTLYVFLTRSAVGGVLIMRLFLDEVDHIEELVTRAVGQVRHMGLYQPRSSYNTNECYFLAGSSLHLLYPTADGLVAFKRPHPAINHTSMYTILQWCRRRLTLSERTHSSVGDRSFFVVDRAMTKLRNPWIRLMPPNYVSHAFTLVGLSLTRQEWNHEVGEWLETDRLVRHVLQLLALQISSIKKQFIEMERRTTRWDINSHSSLVDKAHKLLTRVGMKWLLEHANYTTRLLESSVKTHYISVVKGLPRRLQWYPVANDHYLYAGPERRVGPTLYQHPYRYFTRGITLGCRMMTYYFVRGPYAVSVEF
ncbi:L [Blacklegged tick chuvirus 2]|uniref:RNA-directed RNA polymerase n=1 Tax=Blacklegged tick chuvirus 2 TaxID=2079604 RepID=A0A2K9YNF4_9VIRU|nr:L [Blacklegged tick chuvirus-2] [Blacklegged tick chuvirus-2]AUW34382.1 L [Blacklegged tick chuvirus-2] [Blacklegged tick chuvirus-2]